jgi:hypothetical protein
MITRSERIKAAAAPEQYPQAWIASPPCGAQ